MRAAPAPRERDQRSAGELAEQASEHEHDLVRIGVARDPPLRVRVRVRGIQVKEIRRQVAPREAGRRGGKHPGRSAAHVAVG
jgi:hypothetical protein